MVQFLDWEDPLEQETQPTPVFLPEKSHEQRSLVGCNPWGHKRAGHDLAMDHTRWMDDIDGRHKHTHIHIKNLPIIYVSLF